MVSPAESPLIQKIDVQATRCGQANGSLFIIASGTRLQYSLDSQPFQSNPAFYNLPSAAYTINVRDTKGCIATSTVQIQASSQPKIDQMVSEPTICGAATGKITIQTSGKGNLSYTLNGGLFQSQSSFSGLAGGNYALEIQDSQQCSLKQTVTVTEDCHSVIYVPKAFTPNDDGKNDLLELKSNFSGMIKFTIFNRWGAIVFHTENGKEQYWDGKYKGEKVYGAFGYLIELQEPNGQKFHF